MDVDEDRIDEAVLALLWLTLHDGVRAGVTHENPFHEAAAWVKPSPF